MGRFLRKNSRTRLIVRSFSSAGSFHGNTVISAFGAREGDLDRCLKWMRICVIRQNQHLKRLAAPDKVPRYAMQEVWPAPHTGRAGISRWTRSTHRAAAHGRKPGTQLSELCRYMTVGSSGRWPTVWQKTAPTTRSGARSMSFPAKQPPMQ